MKASNLILICALAPAMVSGCALTSDSDNASDDDGTIQQDIEDGTLDTNHPFDVGVCTGGLVPDGQPNAGTCAAIRCSGTLIAPNVVLTARHCVKAHVDAANFCDGFYTDDPITANPAYVTTSPTVASGSPKWYTVKSIEVPAATGLCTNDLALLILDKDVPRREARPAGINFHRDVAKHPPKEFAIVARGYLLENLDTGPVDNGGFMRRISKHIPFVCASDDPNNTCEIPDFSSPPTNVFVTPTAHIVIGRSIMSGDSGAGVFDQKHFHNGKPNVIGIVVANTYGEDHFPNFGIFGRIDTHADFFRDVLRRHCGRSYADLVENDSNDD